MAKKPARTSTPAKGGLPSREEILAFIADNPGETGKREIARAFGITGSERIPLKRMLKDLADEGVIEKRNKRLNRPGDLPPVTVLEVTERTADGDLVAVPAEWDETAGPSPRIVILRDRRGKTPAPGIGDRALARLTPEGAGYSARVIRLLERRPETVLGVVRMVGSEIRLEPVDRKQREAVIAPDGIGGAKEGDLVRAKLHAEPQALRRRGRCRRSDRPDAGREGGLDDRHPRPWHSL